MYECNFKYGEEIEVRDKKYHEWKTRYFYAYQPNALMPFVASNLNANTSGSSIAAWKYARYPTPKIKPGHPIMVRGKSYVNGNFRIAWFKRFDDNGVWAVDLKEHIQSRTQHESLWPDWELLPNYNYKKDPV